ncbi:MAG: hypothetical protein EOO45_10300 [Flavobacterium sp.]|nr:MAG: hypothetical protein EOO45_10300 [Flavobacterium sp.]
MLKVVKVILPVIFIFWLGSKFLNRDTDSFLTVIYEMGAILFLAATLLMPVFLLIYWIVKRKEFNKSANYTVIFFLIFSAVNIVVMTLDPGLFR